MAPAPWLIVVTGASRGYGRSLAEQAVKLLGSRPLTFLLLARSAPGLLDTEKSLQALSADVTTHCHAVDIGKLDTLENALVPALKAVGDLR
jgi:short-subunit dehydrogenase